MTDWPNIRGVISDLDGVVYRGEAPIPEAVAAVLEWHRRGLPYAFVTNNSTKSAADFAVKLNGFGIPATADQVVTTSFATGELMKKRWPAGTRTYVIGAPALHRAIEAAGFTLSPSGPEVVVVGLDREITYAKLKIAVQAVLDGAMLIGTNPDRILPTSNGFEPGAGSLLAAVSTAAGLLAPPIIVGKPEPHMVETALGLLGTERESTILVGDQLATDIQAGKRAGVFSVLVQTGVPAQVGDYSPPDFVIRNLLEIPLGHATA